MAPPSSPPPGAWPRCHRHPNPGTAGRRRPGPSCPPWRTPPHSSKGGLGFSPSGPSCSLAPLPVSAAAPASAATVGNAGLAHTAWRRRAAWVPRGTVAVVRARGMRVSPAWGCPSLRAIVRQDWEGDRGGVPPQDPAPRSTGEVSRRRDPRNPPLWLPRVLASLGVTSCPVCGRPVARRGARGPTPTYCSARCKGAAKTAAKRQRSAAQAAGLWDEQALAALMQPWTGPQPAP